MPKQDDFLSTINALVDESTLMTHRYYSFDFCYAHFHPSNTTSRHDVKLGCYILWGYLSSWGMLRASFLLQKNPLYLKELVDFILKQDNALWDTEIKPENFERILQLYKEVKKRIIENNERDIVLVTKILLGVFAIAPAYDFYFSQTFKKLAKTYSDKNCSFGAFNQHSLEIIYQFSLDHQEEIQALKTKLKVKDFAGTQTPLTYSTAKIVDMYGFYHSFKDKLNPNNKEHHHE
ncbi:hypothetical protein [Lonepinella sp. BR2357]|uniref:hypothetical protein n=1 Tax=Lonepinella sp. BR2357 TaxID=3434549 RepID=UPI003F6DB5A7